MFRKKKNLAKNSSRCASVSSFHAEITLGTFEVSFSQSAAQIIGFWSGKVFCYQKKKKKKKKKN